MNSTNIAETTSPRVRSKRNKRVGLYLIAAPFLTLIAVGIIWTMVVAVLHTFGLSEQLAFVKNVINIILGIIGVIGVFGIIFLVPIGIVFIVRKELPEGALYDERSGKGKASEVPIEIKKWNWGAAGLGVIWSAYHRVWLGLLAFVPVLGVVWWIIMGMYGSEWAWRKNRWGSVQEFKDAQRGWERWGIVVFILSLVAGLIGGYLGT